MTTNYSMPVVLGSLAAGNQPLSDFDTDFDSVARMGTYMCSATGTNAITLTGLSGYPTLNAYGNIQKIGFIPVNTTTTLTTISVSPLGTLNAYLNDGTTQVGSTQQLTAGRYYEFAYNSTLNSSAGGWQLTTPSLANNAVQVVNIQTFTATGAQTYTATGGLLYAVVEMLGGGGGGGGVTTSAYSCGGGGGAGGYLKALLTAAQIGSPVTLTVGAGGAAGASSGTTTGGTGSTTSITGLLSCTGGTGGSTAVNNAANGGGGGAATIVTGTGITITGGGGVKGNASSGTTNLVGGSGASTPYGTGGNIMFSLGLGGASQGGAGTGYGAGGGGAFNVGSGGAAETGGAGQPGIVIITEYCT